MAVETLLKLLGSGVVVANAWWCKIPLAVRLHQNQTSNVTNTQRHVMIDVGSKDMGVNLIKIQAVVHTGKNTGGGVISLHRHILRHMRKSGITKNAGWKTFKETWTKAPDRLTEERFVAAMKEAYRTFFNPGEIPNPDWPAIKYLIDQAFANIPYKHLPRVP
jgi:hypothetical protein